ncbi:MAG: hypothetical protein ACOCXM_09695 [Myxococcota bacterium]
MSIGERLVRVGAPLAVAVLFSSVILAGGGGTDRDLHLISPDGALPGRPMALRALLIEGLDDPGRASMLSERVDVRLTDGGGRPVARTRLEPSAVAGLEGSLTVPDHARGTWQVRARVGSDGDVTRVHAPVTLGEGAPRMPVRGRLASALQQYLPFAVRPVGDAAPPVPFEARVVGGACVPEVPCRVLVWVGEPAASVAVEPTGAVSWEPSEPEAERPVTSGIEAFTVVVHGPEGDLHLVASRGGEPVARRTVRLPIAQGAPVVRLEALARAPAAPAPRLDGVDPGTPVLVDAFRDGYWERAGSARVQDDGSIALPFPPLGPGVWQLQVRPDVLSVETAGTRLLSVHADESDPASAVRALARRTKALGFDDSFATAVLEARAPADVPLEAQAAFLAAHHELELLPPPEARSSYVQRMVGAEATTDAWRVAAATGVLLVGLGVAIYLWWRGARAGREARGILAASGEEPAADSSGRWTAIGAAVFVFLIFAVIALFVLSRSKM